MRAVQASPPEDMSVSRRRFVRGTFWAGAGVALLGATGGFVDYLWPRGVRRPGALVAAGTVEDYPAGGPPVLFRGEREFWLVHLDPAETRPGGSGGGEGLLALWRRCPHLGCSVPWEPSFEFLEDRGWFRCPCHRSTYTKAGILVEGPAPRSMDTMLVTVAGDGTITVDTREVAPGGRDNPSRAVRAEG